MHDEIPLIDHTRIHSLMQWFLLLSTQRPILKDELADVSLEIPRFVFNNLEDAYDEALKSCESAIDVPLPNFNTVAAARDLEDRMAALYSPNLYDSLNSFSKYCEKCMLAR